LRFTKVGLGGKRCWTSRAKRKMLIEKGKAIPYGKKRGGGSKRKIRKGHFNAKAMKNGAGLEKMREEGGRAALLEKRRVKPQDVRKAEERG